MCYKMERRTVILIMCCAGLICTIVCVKNSMSGQVSENLERHTDNSDDRWIWGYANDKNNNNKTEDRNADQKSTTTAKAPVDPSPCPIYDHPKPDFGVPGRRISEEKCEEYKWERTVKEAQERADKCLSEMMDEGLPPLGVVGGRPTLSGEFPHMGALGWKAANDDGYIFKCGSTLISSKFVLTAAHCSKAPSFDTSIADVLPKIVRLNQKNLFLTDNSDHFTEDVNISRIIVHSEYKPPKKYFDIALMELQFEVHFGPLIQPACLWTKADVSKLGPRATLTGWGVLKSGSNDISPELQAGEVDLINNSFCDQLLHSARNRNWWGLNDHQLCAGKLTGGIDACQGDSGGPLQVKQHIEGSVNESVYYVIGVTSFGIGCALPNYPGIYTRVSSFVDWIEEHVWPSD